MGCPRLPVPILPRPSRRRYPRLWPEPRVEPYSAITHVHTDTTATTGSCGATTTITLPTGIAATDVAIVVFGVNTTSSGQGVTAPAGWARIGPTTGLELLTGGNDIFVTAFAALGNVGSLVFTNANSSVAQSWVCAAFSGVNTGHFTDAQDTTGATNSGQSSLTINSITIVTANAIELIACVDWLSGVFSATNFTVSETSQTNVATGLLYNPTALGTGATGTVSLADNAGSTGQILAGFSFALRPAAGAATTIPNQLLVVGQSIPNAVSY